MTSIIVFADGYHSAGFLIDLTYIAFQSDLATWRRRKASALKINCHVKLYKKI
jgi:hypothetical protein